MKPDYKFSNFVEETLDFLNNGKRKQRIDENVAEDTGIAINGGDMDIAVSSPHQKEKELYRTAFENCHFAIFTLAKAFLAFREWIFSRNPQTFSAVQLTDKQTRKQASILKSAALQFQKREKYNGKSEENADKSTIMELEGRYAETIFKLMGQIMSGVNQLSMIAQNQIDKDTTLDDDLNSVGTLAFNVVQNGSDKPNESTFDKFITADKNFLYYCGAFLEGFGPGGSIIKGLNADFDDSEEAQGNESEEAEDDTAEGRKIEDEEALKRASEKVGFDFDYMTQDEIEEAAERFATELRDYQKLRGVDLSRSNDSWESDESFLKRMTAKLANVHITYVK